MIPENYSKILGLITSSYINRMDEIRNVINNLDNFSEIALLYLSISPEEKSSVKQVVDALSKQSSKMPSSESQPTSIKSPASTKLPFIELTVSDVHRNEQVNIAALSKGIQTVLCSNLTHETSYLLWPMVGDSDQYTLNPEGESAQQRFRMEFGPRLDLFPRFFIATVYAYTYLSNNTVKFWQDMINAGLFKYWDPEKGPYLYYQQSAHKELQMLRVFKSDKDLNQKVKPNAGFRNAPIWVGGAINCNVTPILSIEQTEDQFTIFNHVLRDNGFSTAARVKPLG